MVIGEVVHASVDEDYAGGYEKRYGEDGFMMLVRKAERSELMAVHKIVVTTVSEIYPHYYPKGTVDFFLSHHSEKNIMDDLEAGRVFLCFDNGHHITGTVTVKGNEICRLFVLPEYQGNGYGKGMLDFAEETIAADYSEVSVDVSLAAKVIYRKRGYREISYHIIETESGDYLCYDTMLKKL